MYYDYHLHSNVSFDSKTDTEDMIKKAIELNMKEIVFTEHYEFRKEKYLLPLPNLDDYINKINLLKDRYKESIKILCGIELGMQSDISDEIEEKIKDYNFDFIIGSVHTYLREDIAYKEYFEKYDKKTAYENYFKEVLDAVKVYNRFDVIGHLDLIKRYYPNKDKEIKYKDYAEIIDEIYRVLVEKGKGIEINSSGIKYGMGFFHPNEEFLKKYYELGGRIVTLGSDAHEIGNIGLYFKEIISVLKDIGFKYIARYEKREVKFLAIDEFVK